MIKRRDFVLIFAGSQLRRFRELAQYGTREGILGDFLLVDEHRKAELHAGRKTKELNDYLQYFATRPGGSDTVTVVALACGSVADESTRRERTILVRDLRTRCREMGIGFREGTISVPIGNQELSPTFVESDWAFNLVAVPQDWTGEPGQIGISISDAVVEDVAFNVVMSATGLWSWCDGAPLNQGILEEHLSDPPIRLVRAATRIVPLGNFADSIAAAAMDPSNNWPAPQGCEKHPNGAQLVEQTVKALAKVPSVGLNYTPFKVSVEKKKDRVKILDAIVLYFSALVANLVGIPRQAWRDAKQKAVRKVEDYVQNRTFQDESELVVRYGGRLREEDFVGSESGRIRAIESDSGVEVPAVQPNPKAWRIIIQAVLGAVDGGAVDGGDSGSETKYQAPLFRQAPAVVSSREVIAPDPSTEFGSDFQTMLTVNGKSSSVHFRSFDSIRLRGVLEALKKRVDNGVSEGPPALSEDRDNGSRSTEDEHVEEAQGVTLNREEAVHAIEGIQRWLDARKGTLLWGISKHLDLQIQEVTKLLNASVERVKAIPQQVSEADARQQRAARRGKWLARLLVLLVVIAVIFPFFPPVAAAGLLAGGAVAIALFFLPYIALLGVLSGWLATAKKQVREQYRMENSLVREYENALVEREHYWFEMHRLEYFHIQYLDWAEILARVVWRPFGQIKSGVEDKFSFPGVQSVSFQFAAPEFDAFALQREQIASREKVAGKGWLNDVFATLLQEFTEDYSQLVVDKNPGARNPDMDTSLEDEGYKVRDLVIHRPRAQLLKMVREESLTLRIAETKANEIRQAVSQTNPSRLLKHVKAHAFVAIDGDVIQSDSQDFLGSILDFEHVPKFERFVYRTGENNQLSVGQVYWACVGLEKDVVEPDDSVSLAIQSRSEVLSFLLASMRLEISQARFSVDELRFLEHLKGSEAVKPKRADGDSGSIAPAID